MYELICLVFKNQVLSKKNKYKTETRRKKRSKTYNYTILRTEKESGFFVLTERGKKTASFAATSNSSLHEGKKQFTNEVSLSWHSSLTTDSHVPDLSVSKHSIQLAQCARKTGLAESTVAEMRTPVLDHWPTTFTVPSLS